MYRRPGRRIWYAFLDYKRKHISLETEDEGMAKEAFARLLDRRRVQELAPSEESLSSIFRITWERAKVNHTKQTAYGLHVKLAEVLEWLESKRVVAARQVTVSLVEAYKSDHRERWGARSINRYLDAWRKAMKIAVELRCATPDVLACFQKLREPRPVPHQRGLTKQELQRFLREVDPRYRDLFRTVLGSGLRDDEIRHLDLADVGKDTLTVTPKPGWTTKGYRYRTIPISADTKNAAVRFLKNKPSLNLQQRCLWKKIDRACVAAEVAHFSMHDLRRAWASHMLSARHKVQDISRWLGHADVLTTMRYLRVVEDKMPDRKRLPW
jgi:integrase